MAESISVFSTFPSLLLLLDASMYVLPNCALLTDSVPSTSQSKHLNLSLTDEVHVQIYLFIYFLIHFELTSVTSLHHDPYNDLA